MRAFASPDIPRIKIILENISNKSFPNTAMVIGFTTELPGKVGRLKMTTEDGKMRIADVADTVMIKILIRYKNTTSTHNRSANIINILLKTSAPNLCSLG